MSADIPQRGYTGRHRDPWDRRAVRIWPHNARHAAPIQPADTTTTTAGGIR